MAGRGGATGASDGSTVDLDPLDSGLCTGATLGEFIHEQILAASIQTAARTGSVPDDAISFSSWSKPCEHGI